MTINAIVKRKIVYAMAILQYQSVNLLDSIRYFIKFMLIYGDQVAGFSKTS